ncbi:hypothetical protein DMB44_04410 [Thermoplasma sp. Kam2015]|uniref:PKD domain-containing protein n=1 Tax=Thermoplasma sp. Kam2015 TaxID=2094122 RepID=UPI000D912557|nr:PKD domain-containing protein [Thermoplasma sp. Kam2015]PYB68293.1 hypothetical protein DMB44_04410 [Thermoplasma sp. Kam2015]
MILSGVGIAGFQALSHWDPSKGHNNRPIIGIKPADVSASSGGTTTVYYGQTVSFSTVSGRSSSATNENKQTSTSGYPPPDYPPYPSTPGWTLDVGGSSVESGTASASGVSYDQWYTQSEQYLIGGYVYTTYSYSETSWSGAYISGVTYTIPNSGGSSGGTDESWSLSTDGASASGTLDVYTPYATISASTTTPDAGQSVSFSSSLPSGVSYSYQWYLNGNAVSGATGSSYSFTPSSPGSYSVYLEATENGYSFSSNTVTISANSDPSISISSNRNPSDAGQTVDFSTSVSGGTGSYTTYGYVLYDGTSTSDSQLASGSSSSFSYTFSSAGQYLLHYSVTDSNGYTASTSITQTVNTDPSVSIASSQNPTDSGRTVEFTSSVSGGTPGYSYSWSVDGNSYNTKDINVSFSSSGSYGVDLTVTDSAGYSVSQSITETVNSDPTVSASSNVSSADVGYPIEFSSTPSGGTGSYSYSWTLNGQQVSTSQDFSYSFDQSG